LDDGAVGRRDEQGRQHMSWQERIKNGVVDARDRPPLPNMAGGNMPKYVGRHRLSRNWTYTALPEGGGFRVNLYGGAHGNRVAAAMP
jgi:hypothetical protein